MLGLLSLFAPLLPNFLLGIAHDALTTKANIETNRDNLAVQGQRDRLQAETDRRKAQRDVLVAEQGHWYTAIVRPLFALPFVFYINKLVLWDKVLGWGSTDDLSPELWQLCMVVVGAYFLNEGITRGARILRGRKETE